MLRSNVRRLALQSTFTHTRPTLRSVATEASGKREGDISDAFASLSGIEFGPLEPRIATVKDALILNRQDRIAASWDRLLRRLRDEIPLVKALGPAIVPEIEYADIKSPPEHFSRELKKRGVAVIRQVIPEKEALQLKEDLKSYIATNPGTKAFPADNPAVFELYWSPSQLKAHADPRLMSAQRFLLSHWHSRDPNARISLAHPTIYADRLRMRQPGDAQFALGPHVDGGSVERWEKEGYGRGGVYDAVFDGRWEDLDSWEASSRLPVVSDMYGAPGGCSVFRALQGWLGLSDTGPREGTILVNPLLGLATAYYLLRPFFAPKLSDPMNSEFLSPTNWRLMKESDSWLHGATPGSQQELRANLHPHLQLEQTMVHAPRVRPGDYVAWHCDTVHAVDAVHEGKGDSSVMYIPSCPLTETNVAHLARQRDCFLDGTPGPDFPGGKGESEHIGRWTGAEAEERMGAEALRSLGLKRWNSDEPSLTHGQKKMLESANRILGFS